MRLPERVCPAWPLFPGFPDFVFRAPEGTPLPDSVSPPEGYAPVAIGGGPVRVSLDPEGVSVDANRLALQVWDLLGPFQDKIVVGAGEDFNRKPWAQVRVAVVPEIGFRPAVAVGTGGFVLDALRNTVLDHPTVYAEPYRDPGTGEDRTAQVIAHEVGHAIGLIHNDDAAFVMHGVITQGRQHPLWAPHEVSMGNANLAAYVDRFNL